MKSIVLLIVIVGVLAASAAAQVLPKQISGGVLNGKAVNLPKPVYPDEPRLAGVGGTVSVDIVIDEAGNVASARPSSHAQPPAEMPIHNPQQTERSRLIGLLEDAAVQAALQARFSQTLLSGTPVKVSGRLVFRFEVESKDQDEGDTAAAGKVISGGILNSRARALPAPAYPAAARAVEARGAVSVQVLIDENGNVISATAVSGHPLLRAAAVVAAREAQFAPTLLSGQPVKVRGIITYNFVEGKPDTKQRTVVPETPDN
jgi:TonB family protein